MQSAPASIAWTASLPWKGEFLGTFALWICVRPGALLFRIGRRVFEPGWMKSKEVEGWCRPQVALPAPYNSIGHKFDPSVVLPADVVQVEIAKVGVGGCPGRGFPTKLADFFHKGPASPSNYCLRA